MIGGAAVGGVMIAARIMERQLEKAREEAGKKSLEQHRKRNHFESTECTCVSTTSHIFSQLKESIVDAFQTEKLTQSLRLGPEPEEKIRIWNEIKLLCFCKATAFIIGEAFLGVLIRVQLNILAGYLYTERVSVNYLLNNNSRDSMYASRFCKKVQEFYLNISNHFLKEGFPDFCEILTVNVKKTVEQIQLQDKLKLIDMEQTFQSILEDLFSEFPERNLFTNPGKFVLSSRESSAKHLEQLGDEDAETYKRILSETFEILESQEVIGILKRLCLQGFSYLTDQLSEDDVFCPSEEGDEFVSPSSMCVPMAKLVPIISSLVQLEEGEETDRWLTHILDDSELKLLSANIYETFSRVQEDTPQTWFSYLQTSISSYF